MKKSFWLALGIVSTFVLPFSAAAADSCASKMDQVLYQASFSWNQLDSVEGATVQQKKGSKMKVVVGTLVAGSRAPMAQIWSDGSCQAVCKLKSLEKEGVLQPIALEMDCQGVGFSPLAMNASLLWGGTSSRFQAEKPTIRFGTWLQGYQQAELEVQVDLYSTPGRVDRRLALAGR